MSKAKKIISTLLAIIVLAGVGFGAYLLFGKKNNKLTEERAITLVNETSTKLNSAIKTIGNGFAGNTSSHSLSGLQSLNATSSIGAGSSATMDNYEDFLMYLTDANAFLEMVNYALNLGSENSIEFNKTYSGFSRNEDLYMTIYRTESVVFEFGIKNTHDDEHVLANTYGVIDYNKDKDEPSAFNFFIVNESDYTDEGVTHYSFSLCLYSIDFESKMFNCYEAYMSNLPNAGLASTFRNKLSKGTLKYNDIKDYVDFECGYDFAVYTGNIANRIDDINMASHNTVSSKEVLFNRYSSNVKNLNVIESSKLDYDNAINLTKVSSDISATIAASQEKYNFFVNSTNNKFYFISIDDYKQFDSIIIDFMKEQLASMTSADADGNLHESLIINVDNDAKVSESFALLKNVVNALESYYQSHKDDAHYVSILLGKCGTDLSLPSISASVYGCISNNGEDFTYELFYESLADSNLDGQLSVMLGDGQ